MSRPYRSVLYIPAANQRAMEKARTLAADAIIFDLEDAVAPAEKAGARGLLKAALAQDYGGRARIVRINGFDTEWGRDDAAAFATGADAVLVVTGDRRTGGRTFSDPRVVEAACDLGAPLITLAGPVPTPVDALAWRSSPIPGAVQAAIEEVLRGELARADRARLDRIAEVLTRPRIAPGDEAWPSDAPF